MRVLYYILKYLGEGLAFPGNTLYTFAMKKLNPVVKVVVTPVTPSPAPVTTTQPTA